MAGYFSQSRPSWWLRRTCRVPACPCLCSGAAGHHGHVEGGIPRRSCARGSSGHKESDRALSLQRSGAAGAYPQSSWQPFHHGSFARHDCAGGMLFVAIARNRVVEGNGANILAPSCGPGSGNVINNSRAHHTPERLPFRGSKKQLETSKREWQCVLRSQPALAPPSRPISPLGSYTSSFRNYLYPGC